MGDWQPIKSVPLTLRRDNTLLLGWLDIGGYALVYRHRDAWRTGPKGQIVHPTHWMPLPAPPQEARDG